LISPEGPNHYEAGNALVMGSAGSRRNVVRHRFDAKYDAVPPAVAGDDGSCRVKSIPVLAKQLAEPFSAARSIGGDFLRGNAADWLLR
jgi:hypothetical protein